MFNNGFNNFYPYQGFGYKQGLFSSLKGKFNWSGILNNTQKTLNIINQAIPVFYQIKPIWNNTKTVFKIMGAIKDDDNKGSNNNYNRNSNISKNTNKNNSNNNNSNNNTSYVNDNTPSFFL